MEETSHLKKQIQYVNFSSRVLASLVDTALLTFLVLPAFTAFAYMTYNDNTPTQLLFPVLRDHMEHAQGLLHGLRDFLTDERTIQIIKEHHIILKKAVEALVQVIILFFIIYLFWTRRAATPGKMLLSCRIADAKTFEAPTKKQYIIRFFGYFLSCLPFFLGFFWIAIDRRKQGFHDKIAGTVVIKK